MCIKHLMKIHEKQDDALCVIFYCALCGEIIRIKRSGVRNMLLKRRMFTWKYWRQTHA